MELRFDPAAFDALPQPVMAVQDGVLVYVNQFAASLGLRPGLPRKAALPQPLQGEGTVLGLRQYSVHSLLRGDTELLILTPERELITPELLMNTAVMLRRSMQGMLTGMDILSDHLDLDDPGCADSSRVVLHGLYQVLRTARNLETLQQLTGGKYTLRMRRCLLDEYWGGLFSHAQELLTGLGIKLETSFCLHTRLYSLDDELVELMFWNLLANAAANTVDGRLTATVFCRGEEMTLRLGNRADPKHLSALFQKQADQVLCAEDGLGVGLQLVRTGAAVHGGSLLLSADRDGSVTALLRLGPVATVPGILKSDVLLPRESLDRGLVGLSGLLQPDAFDPRDIF